MSASLFPTLLERFPDIYLCLKIRAAHCKTNKAQTLYSTDSYVCSIVPNLAGTGFVSGHADGSIVRWYIAEDSFAKPQGIAYV
jgi:intraflagellar transport protein 172